MARATVNALQSLRLILDEMGVVRGKGTVNNLEQVEGLVDTARRRMREDGERWAS